MSKVLVVRTKTLFADKHFKGFLPVEEFNFERVILENFKFIDRELAEDDPTHRQIVGYSLVYNPKTKKVYYYYRSKVDKNYKEKRLQGDGSLGVGGHGKPSDAEKGCNPINISLRRELKEEVGISSENIRRLQPLGYINDESNSVGKVHFAVVNGVFIENDKVNPLAPEMSEGSLVNIETLEKLKPKMENWSKILIESGVLKDLKNV